MNIKADVISIGKLKEYFFIVPDYQREYVWKTDDQVEQFLIDIDNEYDSTISIQKSYFIGSIIIVKNDSKYDVIDGQQRLTTLMLSLCAFRDLLRNLQLDKQQSNYLQAIEDWLSHFDINTAKTSLRLELQYEESKGYLNSLFDGKPFVGEKSSSIIKMEEAYNRIKNHLNNYLNLNVDSLVNYARYFLTKIELVVIESENLSSALKIFETINQRGAGLNAMDLVKNLLFSKASPNDFQKIKDTWKDITTNLQKCNEDNSPLRFLRYFLMARYHDGIIREDDIYKWIISNEGKNATNYETQPINFANELKIISKRYSDLVIATELLKDGGTNPAITNIGFINKYKSRQHLILILALDANCQNDVIEYLGNQIESFFFYSSSLGIQAKSNEGLFANWASKLRGLKDKKDVIAILNDTMLLYLRDKSAEFKTAFINIRHDAYNPLYRLRYILGKIENSLLSKAGMPTKGLSTIDDFQLEHILPQTPLNGNIPSTFKNKDDYTSYVFRLGNVTLLESNINQACNNFNDLINSPWFESKQKEYSNSSILTTNLLDDNFKIGQNTNHNRLRTQINYVFTSWDKDSILRRQEILLELALDTWRINNERIDK